MRYSVPKLGMVMNCANIRAKGYKKWENKNNKHSTIVKCALTVL